MSTKLLFQGHSSYRITSKDGRVIFVDPYVGEGYDVPADIVLSTHGHYDHNQIDKVTQKPGCVVITHVEALAGGKHNSFDLDGITVEAVYANNVNHPSSECVGYLITVDGIKIYGSGDTNKTEFMETLAAKNLDYALIPCDGVYNMDMEEAAECAQIIGAKHTIPIHMLMGELFDRDRAELFKAPNRLIVAAGEEIEL